MKTGMRQGITLAALAICMTSCVTHKMWEATDPNAYVEVPASVMSEEELKRENIEFFKDDASGRIYAMKTRLQKLRDYTIRTFATPITVVLDAASVALVVVAVLEGGNPASQSADPYGNSSAPIYPGDETNRPGRL